MDDTTLLLDIVDMVHTACIAEKKKYTVKSDNPTPGEIAAQEELSIVQASSCPAMCNNQGTCVDGVCQCDLGKYHLKHFKSSCSAPSGKIVVCRPLAINYI